MMEMIGKMLKGMWTHLQIAFNDNYTVDGFEKTNKKFELPGNLVELDSSSKRRMTICNLFANQQLSIFEIVKLLDSSLHQVVPALIENGLIKERRRNRVTRGETSGKGGANGSLSILPKEPESEERSKAAVAFSAEPIEVLDLSHTFANVPQDRKLAS
jgi:hypothetical protein